MTLRIMTLRIMTLRIMTLRIMTLRIMESSTTLSVTIKKRHSVLLYTESGNCTQYAE
jgi:hypothetical protein